MKTMDAPIDVLLTDGTTVQLRPICPEDADAIVAMHSRFSERTRYLRYFSPYPRIPARDLRRFVNVDHRDREAFVVLSGERIVAVGRYDRLGPDAPDAEVAFVVEDAFQGRGIGSVLLEYLAEAGRQVGLTRFVAEVLPANGAMLRVFADFGYHVERQYADGVVHLTFPIAPTEQTLQVQHGRELRTEARSIARLLTPRGVVVYGASASGQGVGAALLAHLRDGGYTGAIVPVHPSAETVAGLPAYRHAADAGVPVDLAVVAVATDAVPGVLADAAAAGAYGLVVISAGFAEAGPAGVEAQRDLVRRAHAAGMRVVGPNCLGIANTDERFRLNATLAPRLPAAGRVGFFSQSGAFGVALLAEADRRGLGLSSFVSAGNRADVSGNDLLQYWQEDPGTDVILLYLETFGNPRKFARLARRIGRSKPVVALASPARPPGVGDSPGPDAAAVTALFARSGVIRVDTVAGALRRRCAACQPAAAHRTTGGDRRQLHGAGRAGRHRLPGAGAGGRRRLPGGGRAAGRRGRVRRRARRRRRRRPGGRPGRHLRAAAARSAQRHRRRLHRRGRQRRAGGGEADRGDVPRRRPAGGGAVVPDGRGGGAGTGPGQRVRRLAAPARRRLPRTARGGHRRRRRAARLRRSGRHPPAARRVRHRGRRVDAGHLGRGGGRHRRPRWATRSPSSPPAPDCGTASTWAPYGWTCRTRTRCGRRTGRWQRSSGRRRSCSTMVPPGVACVVELVEDPAFGPVVGFGLGGVATELLGDRAWRAAPLTDRDAIALVDEPRAAPLLRGYRGAQAVDREALADLLLRVGRLADEQPRVRALTLNPVLARPDGLSVLHAVVHVGAPGNRPDKGPRHL